MVIEASIDIDVLPEVVFTIYAEVNKWHEWDPDTLASHIDGPFQVGVTGWLRPTHGREVAMRLTNVEENRCFTVDAAIPLCVLRFGHELQPMPAGVRVTHRVSFHGPLAFLFRALIGGQVRRGLPLTMASLKRTAEAADASLSAKDATV